VERHNTTAEIYQAFKDDVDTLFSGQLPIGGPAQSELLGRIHTEGGQLMMAMEAEKQYLVCLWLLAL
jgi:hypothetical protein